MIKRLTYVNKVKFPSAMPSTVFSGMNALGFAQNGVETHLLCQTPMGDYRPYWDFLDVEPVSNLHIVRLAPDWNHLKSNEIFYLRAARYILSLPCFSSQDVVLTRDPGFLPFLYFLKNKTGCKTFYQSHNFYLNIRNRRDLNRVNKNKYHWFESWFLPSLDGLLTLQSAQADLYLKHLSLPVKIAWPGLSDIGPCRHNFLKHKTIAYVGSFQPKKGLETAISVFKRAQQPGWKLRLLGGRNENEQAYAKKLIREANLKDVEISGWLSYGELKKQLSNVSLGFLLLEDNFYNRFLTAPSKLFDYLAFGIPIIATDLPSLKDFIQHNKEALLHKPGDIEGMANSLKKLMTDSSLAERLSQACLKRAETFLWERQAAHMLKFME